MQIFEDKKLGRPRMIDPHAVRVQLRFTKEELARIDTYTKKLSSPKGNRISRSAAIRALVLRALEREASTI